MFGGYFQHLFKFNFMAKGLVKEGLILNLKRFKELTSNKFKPKK